MVANECPGCGIETSAGLFCFACQRFKQAAISAVARAIRDGRLTKAAGLACQYCGGVAAHWDHRDYGKPLDVAPACRRCNSLLPPGALPANIRSLNVATYRRLAIRSNRFVDGLIAAVRHESREGKL